MSHQKVRGSDWQFPETSGRREYDAKETVQRGFIGFRLAHDGSDRVFLGGGWGGHPESARVADRCGLTPSRRSTGLGFRLVREEK